MRELLAAIMDNCSRGDFTYTASYCEENVHQVSRFHQGVMCHILLHHTTGITSCHLLVSLVADGFGSLERQKTPPFQCMSMILSTSCCVHHHEHCLLERGGECSHTQSSCARTSSHLGCMQVTWDFSGRVMHAEAQLGVCRISPCCEFEACGHCFGSAHLGLP